MSDWRNNPRTGKSTFMPLLDDIDARLKLGETLKQIYDSYKDSKALEMSYPQFTRYAKKYCNGGNNTPAQKLNIEKTNPIDEIQVRENESIPEDLLSQYKKVCFGVERLAIRALDADVSIETIKSWKCPNQVNLGTTLSNYIQNK